MLIEFRNAFVRYNEIIALVTLSLFLEDRELLFSFVYSSNLNKNKHSKKNHKLFHNFFTAQDGLFFSIAEACPPWIFGEKKNFSASIFKVQLELLLKLNK